jgi:hypothetical protein
MNIIGFLITGTLILLFISAALAPIESLGWYAGWFGDSDSKDEHSGTNEVTNTEIQPGPHYLIYLSGIGAIAPDSIPEEEMPFVAGLEKILPTTNVISDVFPYSVTNMGLTGQRITARIWRSIEQMRLKNPMAIAAFLVNLRNVFQVLISADQRFGPVYNLGVAKEIRSSLLRNGYRIGSGTPVTLLGWSGGGQIALGAAWYLPVMLKAPVRVVSLGGVMSDDVGIERVKHLWHLWGTKDPLAPLGERLYAGRWPIFAQSGWNKALKQGKISMISIGPFAHNGKGNYFDNETTLPTGETHMQFVLNKVHSLLDEAGLLVAAQPENSKATGAAA